MFLRSSLAPFPLTLTRVRPFVLFLLRTGYVACALNATAEYAHCKFESYVSESFFPPDRYSLCMLLSLARGLASTGGSGSVVCCAFSSRSLSAFARTPPCLLLVRRPNSLTSADISFNGSYAQITLLEPTYPSTMKLKL